MKTPPVVDANEAQTALNLLLNAYDVKTKIVDVEQLFAAMNWARSAHGIKPICASGRLDMKITS